MTERKYSVSEIDMMREAIRHQLIWGDIYGTPIKTAEYASTSYNAEQVDRATEDRLRTYMLAGIDPSELIYNEARDGEKKAEG